MKNLTYSVLLDFYNHFLTDKQIETMEMYYNQDMSLAEISENLGVTRQGVRDNIKRAEATLDELEQEVGAVRRYNNSVELINNMEKSVKYISDTARSGGHYRIYDEAQRILHYLEDSRNGI